MIVQIIRAGTEEASRFQVTGGTFRTMDPAMKRAKSMSLDILYVPASTYFEATFHVGKVQS